MENRFLSSLLRVTTPLRWEGWEVGGGEGIGEGQEGSPSSVRSVEYSLEMEDMEC